MPKKHGAASVGGLIASSSISFSKMSATIRGQGIYRRRYLFLLCFVGLLGGLISYQLISQLLNTSDAADGLEGAAQRASNTKVVNPDTGERHEGDWKHGRPLDSKMKTPSEESDRKKRKKRQKRQKRKKHNHERDKEQPIYTKWLGAYESNAENNFTASFDNRECPRIRVSHESNKLN